MEDIAAPEENQGVAAQALVRRRVAMALAQEAGEGDEPNEMIVGLFLPPADAAIATFLQVMQEVELPQDAVEKGSEAAGGMFLEDLKEGFRAILKTLASQAKGDGH